MRRTLLNTSPPARQPRAGQLSEAREHRKTRQKPERPRPGGPARGGARESFRRALFRLRLEAVSRASGRVSGGIIMRKSYTVFAALVLAAAAARVRTPLNLAVLIQDD